jgi:uridine kinase
MTWSRGSSLFHQARSKSSIAAYRSLSITGQTGRSEGQITSTKASSFEKSFDEGRHNQSAITSTDVSRRPFLIGVAGGSSSGKTTISERLVEIMGAEHLARVELDSYYAELGDLPLEERRLVNYDHPDAFDWPLLNDHIAALANGGSVQIPVYDYVEHNRSDETRLVEPARVIVVDGILVFWDRALRDRFDLKIFVDTGADIRLIRRLRRDVAERGRTVESVIEQYLTTVKPAHERFIEPSKVHADVIIPAGGLNRPALEVLLARVREIALDDE